MFESKLNKGKNGGYVGLDSTGKINSINLPPDVYVNSGVYSNEILVFTNTTGGTFSVTGVSMQDIFGSGGRTHWGLGNNDIVSQPFGYVANMYLYNRKLSVSEIKQQFIHLSPRFT
jgi:hypothetical protein